LEVLSRKNRRKKGNYTFNLLFQGIKLALGILAF